MKLQIEKDEIIRVYNCIEKMHQFFHQPMHFVDVDSFAMDNYKEIHDIYYNVIWNWLPDETKREIEER